MLRDERPANGCTLRGIAKDPGLPSYKEVYGLEACAIATYPMYKGLARLVGMDVLDAGDTLATELRTLRDAWNTHDFFFFHVKKTDSAGEDGNFDAKVKVIEETDASSPRSWPSSRTSSSLRRPLHPGGPEIAFLARAAGALPCGQHPYGHRGRIRRAGVHGRGLGHVRHVDLMPLAMAHADKLTKYGA